MAQDDYYYEIQLTNKQLVFYFMAGATGLILSFLAGVMVGRGVDTAQSEVQARSVVEERVVAEEPAVKATPSPELTYAQRLEADRTETTLERPKTALPAPTRPASATAPPPTVPGPKRTSPARATPQPAPERAVTKATPAARAPDRPAPPKISARAEAEAPKGEASFTIQVGAFKDKAPADSVATQLKAKGFAAYIVSPEGPDPGLFVVRVGHYAARADAERAAARLHDQEKFKPYIVKE